MVWILYALLTFLVIWSIATIALWAAYVPSVVQAFSQTPRLIPDPGTPLEEGEDCTFQSNDGFALKGTYLRTPALTRLGVIVFCHELAADRWAAPAYVADLRERGFDVFTFDFRNHGQSDTDENYEPMPWLTEFEVADMQAAVNYVCSRPDADERGIGMLGISRGGTAALYVAARDPRIVAIATDGAFGTELMQIFYIHRFMAIYTAYARLIAKIPDRLLITLGWWAQWIIGRRRGCRFVAVERQLRRVRQPCLIIHGERDSYVPLNVSTELQRLIGGRTRRWDVEGAKHNQAIKLATDEYHRHLARFFQKHLAAGRRR
ncbi:MAG: alpha/beta fold hydrolase [Pirellulales bacterium]|nr:alpha/beta fold hydrolase [Planctomycetales bacterium]